MIQTLPIKVKKDKYYKHLKSIYDISVVQTHRCVPDKLPKIDYKLCVILGSSGNGKTSTLKMFQENTNKWYNSFDKLIEDLNKSTSKTQSGLRNFNTLRSLHAITTLELVYRLSCKRVAI